MLIDRRAFRFFDWFSFSITLILLTIGLIFVYSSTYTPLEAFSSFFKKQCAGAVVGLIIYFIFCSIELHKLSLYGSYAFLITIMLLIYTHLTGWIAMGGKRWISLYIIRFQPSELARLFLGAFIANSRGELTSKNREKFSTPLLFPFAILFFTFLLIRKQPDLGSALIILFSGTITIWVAGLGKKIITIIACTSIVGAPIFWKVLKPYQKQRVLVVLGYGDQHKERYHIEQSKIAIGSGGLWGKGFLKGTQNKLKFLPEDHTDCIFSVICEEWGFVGALLILSLFTILFSRLISIIASLQDISTQIVATGLISHIMLSVCINIGMVTGLLPMVGIPLPLLSYGLTNLWVTLASLGWLNNIAIHRYYR